MDREEMINELQNLIKILMIENEYDSKLKTKINKEFYPEGCVELVFHEEDE